MRAMGVEPVLRAGCPQWVAVVGVHAAGILCISNALRPTVVLSTIL